MGPSFFREIYDIDTLDTRFMTSSSVPYRTVIEARSDPDAVKEAADRAQARAPPPKWQTPEFYLYYLVILWAVPYMFWVAYSVSRRMLRISSQLITQWFANRTFV